MNLSGQVDLHYRVLCGVLKNMTQLKRLNLSFTKANKQVSDIIVSKCKKLEYLYYESCRFIHDACLEDICNDLELSQSIRYLNVDNVFITKETLEKCLLTCPNLKLFQCDGIMDTLTRLYQTHLNTDLAPVDEIEARERAEKHELILAGFRLDTFYTEPGKLLKQENMEALSLLCPNLKHLHLSSIGTRNILDYLHNFSYLSELVIANSYASFSFQFGGSLSSLLKTKIGRQLKSLHLVSIVDVNLRSIVKWCQSLVKLNVEFNGYYEPAQDMSMSAEDYLNTGDQKLMIKTLRSLSISNVNTKFEQINLNVEQFMADIQLLMSRCAVTHLKLSGLCELDDAYFMGLFHPSLRIDESIETLEFRELNKITIELLSDLIARKNTALRQLDLMACKLVSKADVAKLKSLINLNQFDCLINYA